MKNLLVLFGGKSEENEISILTYISIVQYLNNLKYRILGVYIDKNGSMWYSDQFNNESCLRELILNQGIKMHSVTFYKENEQSYLLVKRQVGFRKYPLFKCIPLVHGKNGEDGCIQGFLEINNIKYSGCNIYASALAMNKKYFKDVLKESNIPVVECMCIKQSDWKMRKELIIDAVLRYGYPVIIKPNTSGSSFGVSRLDFANDLKIENAFNDAFRYSSTVIVEKGLNNFVEVQIAIMKYKNNYLFSDYDVIKVDNKIFSFNDKYKKNCKSIVINSNILKLEEEIINKIKEICCQIYEIVQCSGIVRMDYFLTESDEIYVNEINTIPGSLSKKLWEKNGFSFMEIIEKLIEAV